MEAVLVWSLVLSWATLVSSARITITPPAISKGETSDITVRCEPGSALSNIQSLTYIRIERDVSNPPASPVLVASAIVDVNNGDALLDDTSLVDRATVSGNVNDIPGSFVEISLSEVSCHDAGSYFCEVNFINNEGGDETTKDDASVEYRASPGNVQTTQTPDAILDPDDVVELKCSGDVGTPYITPTWSWQWKDSDVWKRYPNSDRITNDPIVATDCDNVGATTLKHVVMEEDNGRMFRCLVNGDEQYVGSFEIEVKQSTQKDAGIHTRGDYSMSLGFALLVLFLVYRVQQ